MPKQLKMYPLEASDSQGLEGLRNSQDLREWLNSWLSDPDSMTCTLQKFIDDRHEDYNALSYHLINP